MSGTEAVMQAVRLARYHTRRSHLVRFCGAYHGWWGDVQPGVGNPSPARETYTLKDMDEDSLRVLRDAQGHRLRAGEPAAGACTRTPTRPATARWSTAAAARASTARRYTDWLRRLREVCTERGIVLIFDEVFVGLPAGPRAARRSTSASRPTWSPTARRWAAASRSAWCAAARAS